MSSPPLADAADADAAAAERRDRFEAVYAACHGPITGYVLRRTACPEDAADVIAETFLTAWRRLGDLPPGPEARLWLYGVARRVLANYRRGERRRSELAAGCGPTWPPPTGRPSPSGELARIAAAFRGLPEPDREVLALSAWEGLDHGQLAVVLGCSRNAVRIRMHRARRRLAGLLADAAPRPAPGYVAPAAARDTWKEDLT